MNRLLKFVRVLLGGNEMTIRSGVCIILITLSELSQLGY